MDIEEQQIGEEVHYPKQNNMNVIIMLRVQRSKIVNWNNVEYKN
jgi:hypothetical protein